VPAQNSPENIPKNVLGSDAYVSPEGSSASSVQDENHELFDGLIGPERILTIIKSRLPLSFFGQAIFFCDASNTKAVLTSLAKFCAQSGFTPALVLFGSNYKAVSKRMESDGFSGDFLVIDCVSKGIARVKETERVFFVDSLRDLTQLQIKILNIIKGNPKVAFVFDSLLALQLYHEEDVVLKFIYSLTKLLRSKGIAGYFIASSRKTVQKLPQFFDEAVELKKFF